MPAVRVLAGVTLAIATTSVVGQVSPRCLEVCSSGSNSPLCLRLSEQAGRGKAFASTISALTSGSKYVERAWLLSMFGVTEDPCTRSDSKLNGDVWTNEGFACRVTVRLPVFVPSGIEATIEIPRRLAFRMSRTAFGVVLRPASALATIRFSDSDLNLDWGGGILEVTGEQQRLLIQLPKTCIQIAYS